MKKFSVAKILSLACLCVVLFGALAFAVFAAEDEKVEIVANNIYYGDTIQLMYAVNAPEGATIKATNPAGKEINVLYFGKQTVKGVPCTLYILETGSAAQAIDTVITFTVEYNGKVAAKSYSVLQYLYTRIDLLEGKVAANTASAKETAEVEMLKGLLEYSMLAAKFFSIQNNTTFVPFDSYQYVIVDGLTVNGVNPTGMYAPGSTPFANIDAIKYDADKYELVFNVGEARMTLDELKAFVVADAEVTVSVEFADKACAHTYNEKVTNPTCTEGGYTTYTCSKCGDEYTSNKTDAAGHSYDEDVTDPTCTEGGYTTYTCSKCGDEYTGNATDPVDHNYVEGVCDACGAEDPDYVGEEETKPQEIVFDFGANGTNTEHVDGSSLGTTKTYTVDGYTLTLTNMSAVYGVAYDLEHNSAIKLGTSSKNGSFTFTVPDEIGKVIINVAKYKTNNTNVSINGVKYAISTSSNDGAYTPIEIDTTEVKTITVATVGSAYRAMIDSITYVFACAHESVSLDTVDATCYEEGVKNTVCDDCGKVVSSEPIPALEHNYINGACEHCGLAEAHVHNYSTTVTDPTCTEQGYTTYKCACGEEEVKDYVDALGHKDEDGNYKCDVCSVKVLPADGEALTIAQAITIGKLFTKDQYSEVKYYVTGIITEVQNTQYGNVVITDGENSILIYGLYSYDGKTRYDAMEYKPTVGDEITVYGVVGFFSDSQLKNAWLDEVIQHECEYTVDATCTKGVSCKYCGAVEEGSEPIAHAYGEATCITPATCPACGATDGEALGHTTDSGVCERCGEEIGGDVESEPVEITLSFANKTNRTEFSTSKQVWKQDELSFTNLKYQSTNNVADYAAPVRLYQNSQIVVAVEGKSITKIVFDCNSGSYATALKNSIGTVSGATVTVSSDKVTVVFTTPVDSFTVTKLTAQVRLDSITVNAI